MSKKDFALLFVMVVAAFIVIATIWFVTSLENGYKSVRKALDEYNQKHLNKRKKNE